MTSSFYTEFLEYHWGRSHSFLKAGTRPVHAITSTRPPKISTFVGVNVYKEPFIKGARFTFLSFILIL